MRKRHLATIVLLGALTPALAACGGGMSDHSGMGSSSGSADRPSESAASEATGNFNDADVAFATNMIPHHRQAVEMAQLAQGRTKNAKVLDLAGAIEAAQDPEIELMSGWLTAWGAPVPEDMGGHDMSGSMPGMMDMSDMEALKSASGAEFDEMFLKMMIEHHRGAVEMATTEQTDGKNPDAVALAGKIEEAQTEEIATMQELLK